MPITVFSQLEQSVIRTTLTRACQKKYRRKNVKKKTRGWKKLEIPNEVEIGVWILTLNDGNKRILPLTSGRENEILHSQHTLDRYCSSQNLKYEDFAQVQYFHNHPRKYPAPLSPHDINSMNVRHEMFSDEAGRLVPVHFYSVSELNGCVIVFHSSAI